LNFPAAHVVQAPASAKYPKIQRQALLDALPVAVFVPELE